MQTALREGSSREPRGRAVRVLEARGRGGTAVHLTDACRPPLSLSQAAVALGGGGGTRPRPHAAELSAFAELRPLPLIRRSQECHGTPADFWSPEVVGSDRFRLCSRRFREERLPRYPSPALFTVAARIEFSMFYSVTIRIVFLASEMLIFLGLALTMHRSFVFLPLPPPEMLLLRLTM